MPDGSDTQRLFALRGATSIEGNTEQAIVDGTRALVEEIMTRNELTRSSW